jgi:hypothetical protein
VGEKVGFLPEKNRCVNTDNTILQIMIKKEHTIKLIDWYFQTRNTQISKSQTENIDILFEMNVVEDVNNQFVKINVKSVNSFFEVLFFFRRNIPQSSKEKNLCL